jgi:hypothetical protein
MAQVHSSNFAPGVESEKTSARMGPEFYDRVSQKAFELYEHRGGENGRDIEDWLEAERLIRQEMQNLPSSRRP